MNEMVWSYDDEYLVAAGSVDGCGGLHVISLGNNNNSSSSSSHQQQQQQQQYLPRQDSQSESTQQMIVEDLSPGSVNNNNNNNINSSVTSVTTPTTTLPSRTFELQHLQHTVAHSMASVHCKVDASYRYLAIDSNDKFVSLWDTRTLSCHKLIAME
jgi:hypothetical protein